jgi:hypothetical protein
MVVRLDAAFEVVLGLVLLLAAATGALGRSDLPRPIGTTAALLVAGVLLVLLGVAIWAGRIGLRALALGNAISAVVLGIWLLTATGFSDRGTALVAIIAAGLAVLAAAQVATLRA